ncbi:MAG: valine--tRNA ligase [Geodermatophilaceae bacterium]
MSELASPPPPDQELPTHYLPAEVEGPLYERWVEAGYFRAREDSSAPMFSIVIPPPNVTGNLHLGHALEHTLIDAVTRRRRMQGYDTLWLPGMDHAGIATQNVVEAQLRAAGTSRHELGRERFVESVWEWKEHSGGQILGQMRRLGDGVDWSRERFTMDEGLSRAVNTMFKRLHDDGLIYRAERIINWCPRCMTALSDIEVDHSEDEGELVSVRYGDGADSLVVATTRLETMLGDTAVAVHSDDGRYRHLVGRQIRLPLVGRMILVVADEHVDPEFGTGAVKVTPAHDPNDFEIGRRHGLPMPTILDAQARVAGSDTDFDGLDRFEARQAVKQALRAEGRVVADRSPYIHSVGHCSRCRTVVEPRLSLQWFVDVGPLARAAGEAVRDGRVDIHPAELTKRYFDWVDNMHDWCISRQLWWGHRIPVWYGPDGQTVCVGPDEDPPGEGWRQDEDVLDTWFSSGLWPLSTLGWPEQTAALERYYPTSLLFTGYDILFFWVVRMMMFGLYATDGVPPFHQVGLHGMVRDSRGKKMSKSTGNSVDPQMWIEAYGADALRFTLARGANPGADIPISEEWVQGSRNFCNKLWNATRFALLNGATVGPLPDRGQLSAADRWILARLHETIADVDAHYEEYEFAKAATALYHFAWDEVCDWYVELSKVSFAAGSAVARAAGAVLGHVLDALLRLLHPLAPYVTETLWMAVTGGESVVIAPWPKADPVWADPEAVAAVSRLQEVVTELRRFRSEQGLRPGQRVPARIAGVEHEVSVRTLVRLDEPGLDFAPTAGVRLGTAEVELDLSGTIDVAAERNRLTRDLAVATKEREQAQTKLGNDAFLAKAPEHIVARIRTRLSTAETDLARIGAQLEALR